MTRRSLRTLTVLAMGALLTSVAAPVPSASAADRRGLSDRTVGSEIRSNTEALWQRRQIDAARQSLSSEIRMRDTEARQRDIQRRIDDISRSTRSRAR